MFGLHLQAALVAADAPPPASPAPAPRSRLSEVPSTGGTWSPGSPAGAADGGAAEGGEGEEAAAERASSSTNLPTAGEPSQR